jgi:hypothetical protein
LLCPLFIISYYDTEALVRACGCPQKSSTYWEKCNQKSCPCQSVPSSACWSA